MKNLICTRADNGIKDICDLTHPLLEEYAKRCNADFKILSGPSGCLVGDGRWHYRIMQFIDSFADYGRIAHIDSDIIINGAPNIFNEVPRNKIGTVFEDVGSRQDARRKIINDIQVRFGNIGWGSGYINTGVFVVSKSQRGIFTKIGGQYWEGWGWDDAHLGYNINKFKFGIYELSQRWNFMTMFAESWNDCPPRFDAYMIHYAGQGIFDKKFKTKLDNMKHDIDYLKQRSENAVSNS